MNKNRIILILFFVVGIAVLAGQAHADDIYINDNSWCGQTLADAGDTYILTTDLVCPEHGLIVGADNITIDGNGHALIGSGEELYVGISNIDGCDTIIIENFADITEFEKGIYLQNCSGSTIRNNTINLTRPQYQGNSGFGEYAIYLFISPSNAIIYNTITSARHGLYLDLNSTFNSITDNTISFNTCGLEAVVSDDNTFTNNIITFNSKGISNSSSEGTFEGNIISNNIRDFSSTTLGNNLSANRFSNNITSKMLDFDDDQRIAGVGDTIDFSIAKFDTDGNACGSCAAVITTSPFETVTIDDVEDNEISGHFIPTKVGTYSLIFTVTDSNLNTTKKIMRFFIGDTAAKTTRYYFSGNDVTHGQPIGSDAKSMIFAVPTGFETWNCGAWVQNSPDEIPDYPLAILSRVDTQSWYKQTDEDNGFIGIQRYVTWDNIVYSDTYVPDVEDYAWTDLISFIDLGWAMDHPHSWYWLALKMGFQLPFWATFPEGGPVQPSYADFTYSYTTTPAIKSISDENIIVLSATADADDTGILNIVLEDSFTLDTSTMDIVLSSPVRVDISINTWNINAPYYKEWIEEVSGSGITATHIISGFAPNSSYMVKKDGALIGSYMSDNLGQITFTCPVGSVFTITALNTDSGGDDDDYRCFLTTLFGLAKADEKGILCRAGEFRDNYLLTNPIGTGFSKAYYKISPYAARFISEHTILKTLIKNILTPLMVWISEKNIE